MFKKKYSLLKYFGKSKMKKTLRKKHNKSKRHNKRHSKKHTRRHNKSKKNMRGGWGGSSPAPTIDNEKNLYV